MKKQIAPLFAAVIVCGIAISSQAMAKTAKDCTAEWRADKAGMQAKGVTEKAYVDQCKNDSEPAVTAEITIRRFDIFLVAITTISKCTWCAAHAELKHSLRVKRILAFASTT